MRIHGWMAGVVTWMLAVIVMAVPAMAQTDRELDEAQTFRQDFALPSSMAVVRDSFADRETYSDMSRGIPLTPAEAAELDRRRGIVWKSGPARDFARTLDGYADVYIDQQRGGIPVFRFTDDLKAKRAAIAEVMPDGVDFDVEKAEFTIKQLRNLQERITEDMLETDWLLDGDIQLVSAGASVTANRVLVGLLGPRTWSARARSSRIAMARWSMSSTSDRPRRMKATALGGSWRRMARAPFGAVGVPGGWTGSELIVIDPDQKRRAAAYDPATDTWRAIARPPWRVGAYSPAYWTGSELVFVERRGADGRGLAAYDPAADSWRTTAPPPLGSIDGSVWADGVIVVASGGDLATAAYDPASDAWTELSPIPIEVDPLATPGMERAVALYWTGEEVFALTSPNIDPEGTFTFTPLDPTTGTWGEPSVGPLSFLAGVPVWTGEEFVFVSYSAAHGGRERDGRYDPATDTWTVMEHPCDLDTSAAVWTGSLILDVPVGRAYDPASGQCATIPDPPRAERSRPLRVWTGTELLEFSGNTGEESPAKRDGITYRPPA